MTGGKTISPVRAGALVAWVIALAALAPTAHPQDYKRRPIDDCFLYGSLRFGAEIQYAASPLAHELPPKLAEALGACQQTVETRPEAPILARLARLRLVAGDGKGALEAATAAAEKGSPTAQVLLGVMQADGVHVPRDHAAARQQFLRAAKQGDPHAHFNLGVMVANGWGSAADENEAASAFRRAANGGDPLAMQILGQRYERASLDAWLRRAAEAMLPEGVPTGMRIAALGRAEPDNAALLQWYEERARSGEAWAQAYLGILLEAGQWMPQDHAAAAERYRAAGLAGDVRAQGRLSSLYRRGLGVPQDREQAVRWGTMWQVRACEAGEREEAKANACDRYAADPFDPQKVTQGTDSFCMRHFAERAVAACAQAVKAAPSNPRLHTQFARALAHTGQMERARQEARTAAASGSTSAMILLGAMDQRGLGGAPNPAEALRWYRKAANAGDPRGLALVSASAMNGVGVEKGSAEAQRLLDEMMSRNTAPAPRAARGGVPSEGAEARELHNRAVQLEAAKRYDEAVAAYTAAADRGLQMSAMNVAQMYEKGIGVKQDDAEAMRRYRKLADAGGGEARYRLAGLASRAGDLAEAQRLYRRNVEEDDHRAMLDLGQMLEQGRGGPKDIRQAVVLYERAAPRSPWAKAKLGALYLQGDGMPKDHAKARNWLRRASDEGQPGARNNLAWMHDRGLGGPVDYVAARELYLSALSIGSAEARGNLEDFFGAGRGAPAGARALDWYRGGAERGVMSAQYRLGKLYLGSSEIKRDEQEALKWLVRAAEQGHAEARKEAADLLYSMGRLQEAALMGHEGATLALAAKTGNAAKAAELVLVLKSLRGKEREPARYPQGVSADPGEDYQRKLSVRAAQVPIPQAAAGNAAYASPYDIVRWFPETDGPVKPR